MDTIVQESYADTAFDFANDVTDVMVDAELTVLGSSRVAVILADEPMRIIETHYYSDSANAQSMAQWLHEQHAEARVYIIGADILE